MIELQWNCIWLYREAFQFNTGKDLTQHLDSLCSYTTKRFYFWVKRSKFSITKRCRMLPKGYRGRLLSRNLFCSLSDVFAFVAVYQKNVATTIGDNIFSWWRIPTSLTNGELSSLLGAQRCTIFAITNHFVSSTTVLVHLRKVCSNFDACMLGQWRVCKVVFQLWRYVGLNLISIC